MKMGIDLGLFFQAVIVALIAAVAGWLTNRASTKAEIKNVDTASRVEMEKEAYERARKLDTDTITRQDAEISELREENKVLKAENRRMLEEIRALKDRLDRIERRVEETDREIFDDDH